MNLKTLKEHISYQIEHTSEIKTEQNDKYIRIKCFVNGELIGELEGLKFKTHAPENIAKDNDEFEILSDELKDKSVIEIDNIEVKPGYRKMGVGKKIINTVKKVAKDEKYDTIYLKARSFGNIPIPLTKLIAFYEKQGFYTIWNDKKEHMMVFEVKNFKENENEDGKKNRFIYHLEKHNAGKR